MNTTALTFFLTVKAVCLDADLVDATVVSVSLEEIARVVVGINIHSKTQKVTS
jgi:hypothetical protein